MVERCESCGREMVSEEDHAADDLSVPYCSECADHKGNLLSRKAVENKLTERVMQEREVPREQAREYVKRKMDEMPAWE
ncbi:MAG: hypothetical protein MUP58_00190 [Candidatus Nanohaloarchaeota archaeon QJJ-9]|nr:hypothetical protein [Candidatus Nanohaloarchaeota archaeon QJJ-9]